MEIKEDKIFLTEKKILEHNEKAFNDTQQLYQKLKPHNISEEIKRLKADENYKEVIGSLYFDKGRTIWLELKVEDSYLTSMILSWMYSKSDHDKKDGLHAMGCSLQTIMFSKPSTFSDHEKHAIKTLYESAFGNQ